MFGLIGVLQESVTAAAEGNLDRLASSFKDDPVFISKAYRGPNALMAAVEPEPTQLRTAETARFPDGITVILIGEIFNDRASNELPTALIHRFYTAHGPDGFKELNGSFSVFIDDPVRGESVVAVDRFASRPVLYQIRQGEVIIAPDQRCFVDGGYARRKVNFNAVVAMLNSGHLVNDDTYVEDVKFLRAGGALQFREGKARLINYWDYPLKAFHDDGEVAYREQLSRMLIPAVERRLRACSTPALLLSGGTDSRALLGACMEIGRKIHVYSYYRREHAGSDTQIAKQLAMSAGMPFDAIRYDPTDILAVIRSSTPAFDGLRGPIYEVDALNQLRGRCDALLVGDESFGWHGHGLTDEDTILSRIGIHRLARNPMWSAVLQPEHYSRCVEADEENFERLSGRCGLTELHDRKDYFYTTERLPRNIVLGRAYLNGFVARVRSPWLDNVIIDFFGRMPIKYRLARGLYLATVQATFPKLFEVPTATSSGNYSETAIYRAMLRKNPGLVKRAFRENNYKIDTIFKREALERSFQLSNRLSVGRFKELVKDSEFVRLRQAGQWLSSQARRLSAPLAASLDREESFSQRRLLENIAILRFTAGERLRLDVD